MIKKDILLKKVLYVVNPNKSYCKYLLTVFSALSLASCNLPVQTINPGTFSPVNNYERPGDPEQLKFLIPEDFQIINQFEAKGTINQTYSSTGPQSVTIKVGPTTYYLNYQFMRKLRLILAAAATPNMLLAADFTKLTTGATVGTLPSGSNYLPTASEILFANLLKTQESIVMPNLLQGKNSLGVEINDNSTPASIVNESSGRPRLKFIVNAQAILIRDSFYTAVYNKVKPSEPVSPGILTTAEANAVKAAAYSPGNTLPNSSELVLLNTLNSLVTYPGVVLLDNTVLPPSAKVQEPVNISLVFGDNQVPGAYTTATQTPRNIIENSGIVNRNADLQVPVLTSNTVPGTNYAGAAVALAAKLMIQGKNDTPAGVSTFNSMYNTLGITVPLPPSSTSPVTFGNFHAAMRRIHDNANNSFTPRPTSLKFAFRGTGEVEPNYGMGYALSQVGFNKKKLSLLAKGTPASNQNTAAITAWLGQPGNVANGGNLRAVVVECSRDAKGVVSFSSTTTNHTVLVKYEKESSTVKQYMYDPGMPNNPGDTVVATKNYRAMSSLEIAALNASPNKLVGIGYPSAPANVLLVNDDAAGPAQDGTTWPTAYNSLQAALQHATGLINEIWIAEGTYKPGNSPTDTFQLKSSVKIYGGFEGTENLLSERTASLTDFVTVLSGDINSNNTADSGDSYHVVKGITGASLESVTIQYGYGASTGPDNHGAGMYNEGASPKLTNVNFSFNKVTAGDGAGLYNAAFNGTASNPELNNVTFYKNTASGSGGAILNTGSSPILNTVTFTENITHDDGGAINNRGNSNPVLNNVTFKNNEADQGGAMFNDGSRPTITGAAGVITFETNKARKGGAMFNKNSSPILNTVTFTGNKAEGGDGGGMCNETSSSPELNAVNFISNSSTGSGGAIINNSNCSPSLNTVTFSSNSTNDRGGAIDNRANSNPVLNNVNFIANRTTGPNGNGGGMYIDSTSSAKLTNVTFKGHDLAADPSFQLADNNAQKGGGIYNNSPSNLTTLNNVTFSDNYVSDAGGGIYNDIANPALATVTFENNTAVNGGGGMANNNSGSQLTNVVFNNNHATNGTGGGMVNSGCSSALNLNTVTFNLNTAVKGGGMYNEASSPTLNIVDFKNNSSTNGGGMFNNTVDSMPTLTSVTFTNNSASGNGGGMYNLAGSAPTLNNVTFNSNTSTSKGGGMYNLNSYTSGGTPDSTPQLTNITFTSNTSSTGAGMMNEGSSPRLMGVTFEFNIASVYGGGMLNQAISNPIVTNVTFHKNSAGANAANTGGGGMYNHSGSAPRLTNVTFSFNSTDDTDLSTGGGGIYNNASAPELYHVTFYGNTSASGNGAAIYNLGSSPSITNSIVWSNNIYHTGAGVFTITSSDIQGGLTSITLAGGATLLPGSGNINADPKFFNPLETSIIGPDNQYRTYDDGLSLKDPTSPVIDTSANITFGADDLDITGFDRRTTPLYDMGAYEYRP
jgi:predicted outer membrane repeat protein